MAVIEVSGLTKRFRPEITSQRQRTKEKGRMRVFTRTGSDSMGTQQRAGPIRSREARSTRPQRSAVGHQRSAAGRRYPAAAGCGPQRRGGADHRFAAVMLAEAATFGVASYLHLNGRIPLGFTTITGEHFGRASIPEAIIGAVLTAGAIVVAVAPGRARTAALGATGFAVLGVLAGLGFVLTSSRPHIAADLAYHLTMLLVLLAGLVVLLRTGRGRPSGAVPEASGR